jgi:prepilin-type N-terminal cleavage/methylation domain-containing protein
MGSSRREPGFTLIEAMIVTVIIGIVSVLAVVAYRKWLQTSYLAEAQDMVSNIRSAEDAFYSENGVTYLPVSKGLGPGYDYPAATPGAFKTGWGAACGGAQCATSTAWQQLAVQPSGAVAYGYSVETDGTAGSVYTTSPPTYATPLVGIKVNGVTVDLSGMAGRPWYVIEADGDFFGRGTFTSVFAFSGNNQLFISNGTQ